MVVSLYQSDRQWTFEEVRGAEPIRVRVPEGSRLLRSKLFGLELFVPSPGDKRVHIAWSAKLVWAESKQKPGRFQFIQGRERVTA